MNLKVMEYRPVSAVLAGEGQCRVSLQVARENTFEFSDTIKWMLARDVNGRYATDRAGAERLAKALPDESLLFFFDGEIQRTDLDIRYGLTKDTDLSLTLVRQNWGGGCLDGLIENFHKLGFEQTGRDAIARNQFTLAVIQRGQVVLYLQDGVRDKPEDPEISVVHRIQETDRWTLSLLGTVQLPLTKDLGSIKSDWNSSAGLIAQWRPKGEHVVDAGCAYVRRRLRGYPGNPFFIRDQLAGHLGWEWRNATRVRPFFVLLYRGGLTRFLPGTHFDKSSLIHDLGAHFRLGKNTALSFSYINNLSHNENTADMGFSLRLHVQFSPGISQK